MVPMSFPLDPLLADESDDDDDFWESRQRKKRAARRASRRAATGSGKKRKVEEQPRSLRYDHVFGKGEPRRARMQPERSAWWDLNRHPEVRDPASAKYRKFRRKFRLPMPLVDRIMEKAQKHE